MDKLCNDRKFFNDIEVTSFGGSFSLSIGEEQLINKSKLDSSSLRKIGDIPSGYYEVNKHTERFCLGGSFSSSMGIE